MPMMKDSTAAKLRQINRDFYDALAEPFVATRTRPHDGFYALMDYLPADQVTLLDIGCGNGRFGLFVENQGRLQSYTGVDFSAGLLSHTVKMHQPAQFIEGDMSQPDFLDGLPTFDVVSCMAAMHHLPGRHNRIRLLQEMKAHLNENGRVIISTWQPIDSERQRRKIRPWSEVAIDSQDVEPNDYLLTWKAGGFAYRYVAIINEGEMQQLAREAGLTLIHQFRQDGREGNLSLYTVLTH